MRFKNYLSKIFRESLTIISPKLNIHVLYRVKFGKKLDLKNPQTLDEKIQWLKLNYYDNNDVIKQCADKYRVREFIEKKQCAEYLNELYQVVQYPEDIDWDILPQKFVIKLNVGAGCNLIVENKNDLNIKKVESLLHKWLRKDFYLGYAEVQYKNVKRYILVEKYLGDENGNIPIDYKFYCMNGKVKTVMACTDRETDLKFFFLDKNWNILPYSHEAFDFPDTIIEKPKKIEEMVQLAEKLSNDFPFVRVDLYDVDGEIFFGELTFTPSGGFDTGYLPGVNLLLGEQLDISYLSPKQLY